MRKYVLPAALLGGLMSCSDVPTAPLSQQRPSPENSTRDVNHIPIPGSYIVRFRTSGASSLSNAAIVSSMYGGTVDRVYTSAIDGAAMHLADDAAAALRADPRVLSVDQDEVIRMTATTQVGATWGLDRLDQRTRPLGGSYIYGANGSGVTVYILDTGINFGQADFGGRAQTGYDAITAGGTASDCEGHGSHVAGTVGSNTYGVAKNVRLVAVRVLDCNGNGSTSSVLAGIDWLTRNKSLPAVANMSIGAGVNIAVNQAVQNSIAAGITYTVSAGNNSTDACNQSPASAPDALTIGASDASDGWAGFSNYGPCVDLLAPGVNITSWWTGGGSSTLSGTSMSSPHVAGAAALYLQMNPTATPAQVRAALIGNATSGIISGVPGNTPNLLLYTGFIQLPSAPVANFSASCVLTVCSFDAGSSTSSWGTPSYAWTFGDATNGSGKTPTHTYATPGTYSVTLTITDPNGSSTKTSSVVINRAPTAAIGSPSNNASFVQGASVTFTGTATDPEDGVLGGTSLIWSSNRDGALGTGASLTTTTLSAGSHVVTLTAKDAQNATATATVAITITANQAPIATISSPANNAVFLLGSSVTFSGAGSDAEDGTLTGASLVWTSNIDGQLGTGASVTTNTLSAGTHTITLTSRDSRGSTGTSTRTVKINQAPTASINTPVNNASFAPGASISFSGTGTDPEDGALSGSALVWSSSLNGQIGTGASVSTSTLSTGTHTIRLIVKDAHGATDTATSTIVIASVNAPPVARFTASCPTSQCTLDASSSTDNVGIVKYAWTWGDGRWENKVMSITKNTWAVNGVYTITLTVWDAAGLTNSVSKQIAVPDMPPVVTIIAPVGGSVFPQGASVTFTGSASDFEDGALAGSALAWASNVDGPIGVGASVSSSTLSVGTHTITLTATDGLGVKAVATRTITIAANQSPTATMVAPLNNAVYQFGSSVTFAGVGADPEDGVLTGASLVWRSSIDGQIGTGATFSTSALSAGTHTITLTARDSYNATGITTRTITITAPNQSPSASIATPSNNAVFLRGASLSFSGSGNDPEDGVLNGASLIWTSSRDGQIGTGASVSTSTLSAGTHVITLTVKDSRNAVGVASISVIVNTPPTASITTPANNASVTHGTSVSLSGSGADAEDGVLAGASLVWRSSRDGQLGTGASVSTSTLSLGTHTITLTSTDSKGASAVASITLTINSGVNHPPVATITAPDPNMLFTPGGSITFTGSGVDQEDGALSGPSLVWSSSLDGQIGTGVSFSTTSLTTGVHTITLTARDAQNATSSATVTVRIVRRR